MLRLTEVYITECGRRDRVVLQVAKGYLRIKSVGSLVIKAAEHISLRHRLLNCWRLATGRASRAGIVCSMDAVTTTPADESGLIIDLGWPYEEPLLLTLPGKADSVARVWRGEIAGSAELGGGRG